MMHCFLLLEMILYATLLMLGAELFSPDEACRRKWKEDDQCSELRGSGYERRKILSADSSGVMR